MAILTQTYAASATITCLAGGTGSNATFVAGRESTQIDNTTTKYLDAIVQGKITVGLTPVVNTTIAIYVWGADTSLATLTYDQANAAGLDLLTGVDSTRTLTNTGTLSMLKLGAAINVTTATSNTTYPFAPFSVATLFGGIMPAFWGLYVTHNTGFTLHATATLHAFSFTGITYTST